MMSRRLNRIKAKLFDDKVPEGFLDFVVEDMKKTGRLIFCPAEGSNQAHSVFLKVK